MVSGTHLHPSFHRNFKDSCKVAPFATFTISLVPEFSSILPCFYALATPQNCKKHARLACSLRRLFNSNISYHAVTMTSPRRLISILTTATLVASASRLLVDKHVRHLQNTNQKTTWRRFKFTNCHSGWGAKELDGGKDCGTMSVANCKAKCEEVPDCMSITWDTVSQKCFRRGYVR